MPPRAIDSRLAETRFILQGYETQGRNVTRDQLAELLIGHDVLPTAQRLDVGQVVLEGPQHLSADQIIARVRRVGSRVSKATVYNTLNLFCERGLLRRVSDGPTRQYYDPTTDAHHHFYNVSTGELTDIPLDAVSLALNTPLPDGTVAAGIEVVIKISAASD
jgi:Fur family iron response transcriptional regulator